MDFSDRIITKKKQAFQLTFEVKGEGRVEFEVTLHEELFNMHFHRERLFFRV